VAFYVIDSFTHPFSFLGMDSSRDFRKWEVDMLLDIVARYFLTNKNETRLKASHFQKLLADEHITRYSDEELRHFLLVRGILDSSKSGKSGKLKL